MSKALIKRSIKIAGHETSITLEPEFWDALKDIAAERKKSLPQLIAMLDKERFESTTKRNLSSHLRVFVLGWIKGTVAG